jgi:hypothetical protein
MFSCLIAKQPDLPQEQAFDLNDDLKIALAVFTGDEILMVGEQWETPPHSGLDRPLRSYERVLRYGEHDP